MIRVNVSLANASVTETETLTAGRVGLECGFTFSSEWDDLLKVAVFEGEQTIEVALGTASVAVVPPECMATAGYNLRIGVYGLSPANAIVIPTVWAKAGKIKDSAGPDEDSFAPATPELVAQIMSASETALSIAQGVAADAEAGEFDGVSPTVAVTETTGGHTVTITDRDGNHNFDVMDGASAYAQAVEGGYTESEQQFNTDLARFKTYAAEAESSANAAAASENNAGDSATAAASSATAALNAKTAAEQARTAAAQSASNAATAASTASTKAGEAAQSATSAASSAATAAQKASEASASATAAAGSATSAGSAASAAAASATAAGNAQTAAETAQGKAEDAQEAAETAQDAAEAAAASIAESAAQIAQNTEDVADLKSAVNILDVVKEDGSFTFVGANFVNKSLSTTTGDLSVSDNTKRASCADYLFVPDGCTFKVTTQAGYTINTICQYDVNKTYLGNGSIKLAGCYYFRFTGYKGDASADITTSEAATAFIPSLSYESATDRLSVVVEQNKTDIASVSERLSDLDNIETYENIMLTLSKWQSSAGQVNYSSSDSRVSTPSGTTFDCYCGDVIGLSNYTGVQFRVGYTTDNGTTWTFGNWQSADYVCSSDGKYIVTIMNTTEVVQSDVWNLAHLFFVRHLPRNNVVIQQHDLQNEESLNFVWASDTHHQIHEGSLYGTPLSLIKQMSQMSKDIQADFFAITGDVVNGYYQVSEQKDNLVDVVRTSRNNTDVPVFIIEGNHDDNSWYASGDASSAGFKGIEQILTNAQFTTYAMNNSIEDLNIDSNNPLGGYWYKDFKKSKTRVIVLNVIDIPYEMNSGGTGLIFYGQYTFGFQNAQLKWLAHEALQFDEAGWSVVFLMHFDGNMSYTTYEVKNIAGLNEIVNAYENNLAGTHVSQVPNFRGEVVYDFTANPSNEVTAWFSGHCHQDYAELIDGVPHLTITNAFNANGGGYDLVTVDKKNKHIITKRYNGFALTAYNRDISF